MLQKFNPKNKDLKVYVNGELIYRDDAKISVFDSVVQEEMLFGKDYGSMKEKSVPG